MSRYSYGLKYKTKGADKNRGPCALPDLKFRVEWKNRGKVLLLRTGQTTPYSFPNERLRELCHSACQAHFVR